MKLIALLCSVMMFQTAQARVERPDAAEHPSDLSSWGSLRAPTQVTPMIWRSGRPTEAMIQDLYDRGVRTIIDLEDNAEAVQFETALSKKLGMEFHSYPTDSFFAPDDAKVNEILALMKDAKAPILVHCYHGEDRTGLVIGLERVYFEKWPAQKAYDEMIKIGFHSILLGLDQYFWQKAAAAH